MEEGLQLHTLPWTRNIPGRKTTVLTPKTPSSGWVRDTGQAYIQRQGLWLPEEGFKSASEVCGRNRPRGLQRMLRHHPRIKKHVGGILHYENSTEVHFNRVRSRQGDHGVPGYSHCSLKTFLSQNFIHEFVQSEHVIETDGCAYYFQAIYLMSIFIVLLYYCSFMRVHHNLITVQLRYCDLAAAVYCCFVLLQPHTTTAVVTLQGAVSYYATPLHLCCLH